MTTNKLDLAHLIALGNAATPAPWLNWGVAGIAGTAIDGQPTRILEVIHPWQAEEWQIERNREFICALVNAFPAIIAELQKVELLELKNREIACLESELAILRQRLDPPVKFENEEGM